MRPINDEDLRIYRLRVRGDLLAELVSALFPEALAATPEGPERERATVRITNILYTLLRTALAKADTVFLLDPDPELKAFSADERVLLADEYRDVISEVMSFVKVLAGENTNHQGTSK